MLATIVKGLCVGDRSSSERPGHFSDQTRGAGKSVRGLSLGGFTLVELVVAILMSSIAVALVLTTWHMLTAHVIRQGRHSKLVEAAERIATALGTELRRCREVTEFGETHIVFVNDRGDMVRYEVTADSQLVRNGVPVFVGVGDARVVRLSVAFGDRMSDDGERSDALLDITIALVTTLGDSSSARIQTVVRIAETLERSGWNY